MSSWAVIACSAFLSLPQRVAAQPPLAGERVATVTAIPEVIGADATWELVWADFKTADGIVGTPDGGLLFAQEQGDTIRKLDANNHESIYLTDTHGAGALSIDTQGRLYAVQRACTDPGRAFSSACQELPRISILAPEQRLLANSFGDGRALGRLNDLIADGKGGAYFTVGGIYYVSAQGVVSTVADQDIRTNGLILSPDGKTLYVTNVTTIVAFDVLPDGSTRNRRQFADLAGDTGGDGMAIDAAGRIYVSASTGVHVISPQGVHLGLIPTPRVPISIAFSGPQKRTMYVAQMGAVGPDGKPWATLPGVRNTAMTLYRINMLSEGFKGRPK
ncbi:MAG TPA: SMP-30/gluconolactonase/LRE family protein [Steroidobacteraceae bacterium]|nr:SMP-30/gluconolactonase/LRE family protein [Steroidobacteraceae bacterium]